MRAAGTIYALDNELKILYWSPAAEEMYGYSASEVMGKDFRQLIRFEMDGQTEVEAWQVLVRDGRWRGDAFHYDAKGKRFHVHCETQFLKDVSGAVVGIACKIDKS